MTWAMTLYRRYVELYGDPIEQPPDGQRVVDGTTATTPMRDGQ
jgi:hypothetical protein